MSPSNYLIGRKSHMPPNQEATQELNDHFFIHVRDFIHRCFMLQSRANYKPLSPQFYPSYKVYLQFEIREEESELCSTGTSYTCHYCCIFRFYVLDSYCACYVFTNPSTHKLMRVPLIRHNWLVSLASIIRGSRFSLWRSNQVVSLRTCSWKISCTWRLGSCCRWRCWRWGRTKPKSRAPKRASESRESWPCAGRSSERRRRGCGSSRGLSICASERRGGSSEQRGSWRACARSSWGLSKCEGWWRRRCCRCSLRTWSSKGGSGAGAKEGWGRGSSTEQASASKRGRSKTPARRRSRRGSKTKRGRARPSKQATPCCRSTTCRGRTKCWRWRRSERERSWRTLWRSAESCEARHYESRSGSPGSSYRPNPPSQSSSTLSAKSDRLRTHHSNSVIQKNSRQLDPKPKWRDLYNHAQRCNVA